MNQNTRDHLRASAERLLAQQPPGCINANSDQHVLAHEVEALKLEIKLQAELLAKALDEAANARDKYQALYDLAPVGFVTLSAAGQIREANQKCTDMLCLDMPAVPGRHLRDFFDATSLARFDMLMEALWATGKEVSSQALVLRPLAGKHLPIYVNLTARASADRATSEALAHVAMVDVSREKLAVEDVANAIRNSGFGQLD